MKKISLVLGIVFIAAWFSSPDKAAFEQFAKKQIADSTGLIVTTQFSDIKVCSYGVATIGKTKTSLLPLKANDTTQHSITIAIPQYTKSYIGLFGRFWQIGK